METMDRIQKQLEENVLATEPGTKDCTNALKVYADFQKNMADKQFRSVELEMKREEAEREHALKEAELRLKRDNAEDELRKERDQAILEEKNRHKENVKDGIELGLKVVGTAVAIGMARKAIRDDAEGHPKFGPAKDIVGIVFRKVFGLI